MVVNSVVNSVNKCNSFFNVTSGLSLAFLNMAKSAINCHSNISCDFFSFCSYFGRHEEETKNITYLEKEAHVVEFLMPLSKGSPKLLMISLWKCQTIYEVAEVYM